MILPEPKNIENIARPIDKVETAVLVGVMEDAFKGLRTNESKDLDSYQIMSLKTIFPIEGPIFRIIDIFVAEGFNNENKGKQVHSKTSFDLELFFAVELNEAVV